MVTLRTERVRSPLVVRAVLSALTVLVFLSGPAVRAARIPGARPGAPPAAGLGVRGGAMIETREATGAEPARWAPVLRSPKSLASIDAPGDSRDNPVVRVLFWDRAKALAAFDLWHPKVAPLFRKFDADVRRL